MVTLFPVSPTREEQADAIMAGARFLIRDCWPASTRFLRCHLRPWGGDTRKMHCGSTATGGHASTWVTRRGWFGSCRFTAGNVRGDGFAPSLRFEAEAGSEAEVRSALDGAIRGWFLDRLADGSVKDVEP